MLPPRFTHAVSGLFFDGASFALRIALPSLTEVATDAGALLSRRDGDDLHTRPRLSPNCALATTTTAAAACNAAAAALLIDSPTSAARSVRLCCWGSRSSSSATTSTGWH
ncbi:MAG: hypothetical protein H6835_19720 [Planctomycetes bacterium]|nr:hypothetical protein [Planctomycetota bacterium]